MHWDFTNRKLFSRREFMTGLAVGIKQPKRALIYTIEGSFIILAQIIVTTEPMYRLVNQMIGALRHQAPQQIRTYPYILLSTIGFHSRTGS